MVRLEPTTRDNWRNVLSLQVRDQQRHFVPSVAVSLAKVHIRPDGDEYTYLPFCIYNTKNELIGFVMLTFDDSLGWSYWFNGFFIDQAHQGKGYGRATIEALIDFVRQQFPHSRCLNLTICDENTSARSLYEKCGFSKTGEVYDGEVVYRLVFPR